jgi:hypothetical protein
METNILYAHPTDFLNTFGIVIVQMPDGKATLEARLIRGGVPTLTDYHLFDSVALAETCAEEVGQEWINPLGYRFYVRFTLDQFGNPA